jgi:cardiolipin synthase
MIEPFVLPLMIIMVAKDILMIIGGMIVINRGVIPPKASWYGKLSTFMFYISVGMVVLMAVFDYVNKPLTLTVLGITAAMMIFALINYAVVFFKIQKQLKNSDNNASVQASITDNK